MLQEYRLRELGFPGIFRVAVKMTEAADVQVKMPRVNIVAAVTNWLFAQSSTLVLPRSSLFVESSYNPGEQAIQEFP